MDGGNNETYLTLDGHVELNRYRYLYFTIMLSVYVLIICFNSTVVFVIWTHRNLHEPMYVFIAALLINSVLFSCNIYPKLLLDFLSDKQIISYSSCLCQAFVYYTLMFAEFLLLAAMAYDRYVSICEPLLYPRIMRRTTISVFLVLAWLVPVCGLSLSGAFSSTVKLCNSTLNGIFCNNSIYKLECSVSGAKFVYSAVVFLSVALFPTFFIVFTYTRILIICYRSRGRVRRKAAHTCFPHLMVLCSFSCFVTYDVVVVRLESDLPKTARLIMTLQVMVYHPLFNPIIYGLKMKDVSKRLRMLLCQCKSR